MPTEAPALTECDLCRHFVTEVETVSTGHAFCVTCWIWRWRAVEDFLADVGG